MQSSCSANLCWAQGSCLATFRGTFSGESCSLTASSARLASSCTGSKRARSHPRAAATPPSPPDGQRQERPRPRRPARRQRSRMETIIDDLTQKKFGRGYIYYGERARLQKDDSENTSAISDVERQSSEALPFSEGELLKPDAVLVAGGTGRTGQWITLGLLNQGFNVRCLTRSFERAEKLFGPSGSNVDVFEASLLDPAALADAVAGSVAVVCAAGAPWWSLGGIREIEGDGAVNLIRAAVSAGTVRRFVLISFDRTAGARGTAKRKAEEELIKSGLPYAIVRAAPLDMSEGGEREILLSPEKGEPGKSPRDGESSTLSRVDLAQVACQTLVHERFVNELAEKDPDAEFVFPSCMLRVANGKQPLSPDKRFWKRAFAHIDAAFADKDPEHEMPDLTAK